MLFDLLRAIARGYYHVVYGLRVTGKENIPKDKPYILCVNHLSFRDPILITAIFGKMRYMAKAELFHHKLFGSLITALGAFPVQRGKGDVSAVRRSCQVLQNGEVLLIFPQGTRDRKRAGLKGHTGAVRIGCMEGVKLLPVGITDGYRLFGGLKVNIGAPIDCALYRQQDTDREFCEQMTEELMKKIYGLSGIAPKLPEGQEKTV